MLLLLVGCAKVVDAPDTIEELMIFGFVNHQQEDPAYPQAFAEGLVPLAKEHQEELEAGYRVDSLTTADMEEAGIKGTEEADISGVSTETHFASGWADVVEVLASPDPGAVFSAVESFEITDPGDHDCFLAGDCEFYEYSARRTLDLGILGKVTQDFSGSFRRTEVEDLGEIAVWRTAAPTPAETEGAVEVQQQYSLDLLLSNSEGGTDRISAIWLEATLAGSSLSDSLMIGTSVNQLKSAAKDVDAFLAE